VLIICSGGPPCLRTVALRLPARSPALRDEGRARKRGRLIWESTEGLPYKSFVVQPIKKEDEWSMDCKVGFIERKVLYDEVFFDYFFVLPDFFHDPLILNHSFFQDVSSIRSLTAEF